MSAQRPLGRTRPILVAFMVAAGCLSVAAPANAVSAIQITCGAILHQDAYLAADLTCPSGPGVTAAANLTIDLRGHHLTGSSAATAITVDYPASVKITHGRLSRWKTGVTLFAKGPTPDSVPDNITIIAVNFLGNGTGLDPSTLQANGTTTPFYTVWRSWFESNTVGIGGRVGNSDITVSGSTFRKNRTAISLQGANITFTGGINVSKSQLVGNGVGVMCVDSACSVDHSGFLDNPVAVRTEDYFTYLNLDSNTITGSTTGVDALFNLNSTLDANIFASNKTAVSFAGNSGSVTNNVFTENGTAFTMHDPGSPDQYPIVAVTGNRVSGNSGDGIKIVGGGAALQGNVSSFNHGWGIYTPGSVDKGGNQAYGNGRSPQCVGVRC